MAGDPDAFPSTMWGYVEAAKHPDEAGYLDAVNRFTTAYWKPVFCFLRGRGYSVPQAEDLTQEFFLTFLQRGWLQPADPQRGRFRNFLLTILCRFVSDRGPERSTRQSQFEQRLVPISALVREEDLSFEPSNGETPEEIFMRQWAEAVIAAVVRRLEAWCLQKGRPDWYRVFAAACLDQGDSRHRKSHWPSDFACRAIRFDTRWSRPRANLSSWFGRKSAATVIRTPMRSSKSWSWSDSCHVEQRATRGGPSMIKLACSCGKQLQTDDGLAGKRAQCPFCGSVLDVPNHAADTSSIASPGLKTQGPSRPLSTSSLPSGALQTGQQFSKYRIQRRLGAGAMGEVWLARDSALDRDVALKILPPSLGLDEERLRRFFREARLAAKLNHPNTVTVYDTNVEAGLPFLAMEYVDGGSLEDKVRREGPLPWREATQVILAAATGLAEAHAIGLVHRDIKPANLLRTAKGTTKVADFGLARAVGTESGLTTDGAQLGTPAYMAPSSGPAETSTPAATCMRSCAPTISY